MIGGRDLGNIAIGVGWVLRRGQGILIKSVEHFIEVIRKRSSKWHPKEPRWFRGEPPCDTPLRPSLYRSAGGSNRENELLQMFRARGAGYSDFVPSRDHSDQWLFLAQHVGLPTRLLDWSEGALIALHFALKEKKTPAMVWMLNPLELNALSITQPKRKNGLPREFPLPWFGKSNPAFQKYAWCLGKRQAGS